MIGISLSRCILDLATDKVRIADVEKIITGTKAPTRTEWMQLLTDYAGKEWASVAEKAKALAHMLYVSNKIEMPRNSGKPPPVIAEAGKYWVDSEDQITWAQQ
jgi:hypothetical protein